MLFLSNGTTLYFIQKLNPTLTLQLKLFKRFKDIELLKVLM